MPEKAETFDTKMDTWRQWQDSPWGRLRYIQAGANLARHCPDLGDGALRVLDLAGGDGGDAVRLAAKGHHVSIVDHAPAMLTAARHRAAEAGLADRVTCIEADIDNLPADIVRGGYDLVLCHNLLQYTDDITATLAAALAPLRPGGLLSVISINRHSEALRIAIQHNDPAAARAALDTSQAHTVTFDTTITLRTADEVTEILDELGCPIIGHYGIRGVCDYITDQERKHDPEFFAELERLELAVADRQPYVNTARFFHLIAGPPWSASPEFKSVGSDPAQAPDIEVVGG
ncbi:MAG: methyltransferase domain-containing protein [Actinophytocola sp.]|uniref:methyltransferase domain-containing protein n=1 Tax=Actinophytocola sp. TaxID=1872138 RepID=UPI003C75A3A7